MENNIHGINRMEQRKENVSKNEIQNEIEINNVSFSYQKNGHSNKKNTEIDLVLKDVNLNIHKGENVGIIGNNGVGKSTFLKLLAGIENASNGEILISNLMMNQKNLVQIRQKVGYVFQDSDSQLFMSTIFDDVAFGPMNYGYDREEVEKRTLEALKKVKIEHLSNKRIYQLSGGEKKLASIATVLSLNPEVILMDEPSVALDPQNRRNLIHILNDINMTKVIASHDLDFIYDTCERTIVLYEGSVVEDGDTKQILKNKVLLEKYGLELPLSFSRLIE